MLRLHALLLPVLLALSFSTLNAQKITFTGTVNDDGGLPLPGATVLLLNPVDSTLQFFASTDASGKFTFKQVPRNPYLLNINFLGMTPVFQAITPDAADAMDIPAISLEPAAKLLNEVQVTAEHLALEIQKDTISYNPDAFQTQPNAVIEDLLKKLPGIEVGADGSIKAQGEDVARILVDGKEFFGDDPKMATKNLPAKALKRVKVYDKQSETSEFTGVDDGIREKTIDLQLKEEFKKGLFGTAEAGYGSDQRYRGKASVNRFTKTNQLSFLGQFNNVNEQGFSFTDRMNFSGGMQNFSGGRGGRSITVSSDIAGGDQGSGLVTTGAAGLNFNYQKNKNWNLRSSYFFNNVKRDLLSETFRQTLFPTPFDTESNADGDTRNTTHSLSLNSDIKIDSTQQIQLTARANGGNGTATNESLVENIVNTLVENRSTTNTDDGTDQWNLNAGLTYMKRLGNRGRSLALSGNYGLNDQDRDGYLVALNEFFTTGETTLLDQYRVTDSRTRTWDGQASFTEPLGGRKYVEAAYQYYQARSDYDQEVQDIMDPEPPVVNPILSRAFNSDFTYHRPGLTFRYGGEVHNINVNLSYQYSELDGLVQQESPIQRYYSNFLPRVTWRWDIGNGKNLRLNYNTRVSPPSITQLSPVIDNSDPLRLYVGNQNLDAEFSHNLGIFFHLFSQFSGTSFFASLNGNITEDRIVTSRFINENFQEVSTPVNIDSEKRISSFINYGRPFKLIHSRVSVNANLSYTRSQNFVNLELLDINRWTPTVGLTISNMNSNVLQYNAGTSWSFTNSLYPDDESLNQSTVRQNYFADFSLRLWKKWSVEGNFTYSLYTANNFADNQALPLLGCSVSRFVLPDDKGQIKLSMFDALDENRGISRNANVNYLEEINTNSIGRYVMLSFFYSLRGGPQQGGPGGSFRMMDRRFP